MQNIKLIVTTFISVLFIEAAHLRADDGLSSVLTPALPPDAALSAASSTAAPSSSPTSASKDPLTQVNAAIAKNPNDPIPYIMRGDLYSDKKMWDEARQSFEKALTLDPQNTAARINLAELLFRQNKYDSARAGFLALEGDKDVGDLSSYMVFLCDLFGGHETGARQELDAFDVAGHDASYYFGNVAWAVSHHDADGARSYLASAEGIYSRHKRSLYEANLIAAGYLPLKD